MPRPATRRSHRQRRLPMSRIPVAPWPFRILYLNPSPEGRGSSPVQHARDKLAYTSKPKSGISDLVHLTVPNLGMPEFGWGGRRAKRAGWGPVADGSPRRPYGEE